MAVTCSFISVTFCSYLQLLDNATSTRYLIQKTAHFIINYHILFDDAPSTCFDLLRPSSRSSFTKKYSYKKFCQMCTHLELKYSVLYKIQCTVQNTVYCTKFITKTGIGTLRFYRCNFVITTDIHIFGHTSRRKYVCRWSLHNKITFLKSKGIFWCF